MKAAATAREAQRASTETGVEFTATAPRVVVPRTGDRHHAQHPGLFAGHAEGTGALGPATRRQAAVREGRAARFEGSADVHNSEGRHWVSGDFGVSQWLLAGTRVDGQEVRVRGCDHWEFRAGEIVRKDSYWKIIDKQA